MSFVEDWWDARREEAREDLARFLSPEDGHPAQYGTSAGLSTDHPWSAVLGAKEKLERRISLNNLRASLGRALVKAEPRLAKLFGVETSADVIGSQGVPVHEGNQGNANVPESGQEAGDQAEGPTRQEPQAG